MGSAERIVFALGALGETGQPAALADGADAVAPAGENLVRVSLMPDVPDQPVGRRVEDMVERDGQFDHAKPRAEMAAGLGDGVDGLGAQFVGQLAQLFRRQVLRVAGKLDAIEQGGLGRFGQKQLHEGLRLMGGDPDRFPQNPKGLHQIRSPKQFNRRLQRHIQARFSAQFSR